MTAKQYPVPLADLLGTFLEKRGLAERIDLVGAVDRWTEVVGARVAANARAEAVTADGLLWVRVKSSAWAAELSMMAPGILSRINEGRDGKIMGLRCRVGALNPEPTTEVPRTR